MDKTVDARPTPEGAVEKMRKECDWPVKEGFGGTGWFRFEDEPGAHDPCYVIMPDGCMLPINHHNTPGVDIARAKFIIAACNAALSLSGKEAAQSAPVPSGLAIGAGLVPLPADALERYSMQFAKDHGPFTNSALADMHIEIARNLYAEAEIPFPLHLAPVSTAPDQSAEETGR